MDLFNVSSSPGKKEETTKEEEEDHTTKTIHCLQDHVYLLVAPGVCNERQQNG